MGEKARAASAPGDGPSEARPPDPNESPAIPACTIVVFGAVRPTRYATDPSRPATQLPLRTGSVGAQVCNGPLTWYQA